jgi:hypothetical protein
MFALLNLLQRALRSRNCLQGFLMECVLMCALNLCIGWAAIRWHTAAHTSPVESPKLLGSAQQTATVNLPGSKLPLWFGAVHKPDVRRNKYIRSIKTKRLNGSGMVCSVQVDYSCISNCLISPGELQFANIGQ